MNIEKLDDELYVARYGIQNIEIAKTIWNKIKNNKEILYEAK